MDKETPARIMTSNRRKVSQSTELATPSKSRLIERLADLIERHRHAEWPKTYIPFDGYYEEISPERRAKDSRRAHSIENQKEMERQRSQWLQSLVTVLSEVYRYLIENKHFEEVDQLQAYPLWLVFKVQKREDRDPKIFFKYLEMPIRRDIESVKKLVRSTHHYRAAHRSAGKQAHLTVPSIILLIARKAQHHKQETAGEALGMPQSNVSRLEEGTRAWTTTNLEKCADYVRKPSIEDVGRAFFKLVNRNFPQR